MPPSLAALQHPAFGVINYAVLAIYLAAMLAIGIWCGRSGGGSAGYFTGEGKVHHWLVGISLLGTYLSSLTMMALPAVSFGAADFTWTVQLPFLLVTALLITGFVLPRFRASGCLSVYEFLERRIHVSSRLIAAVAFIVLSVGRMGLVLFLPALAFCVVTGAHLIGTIAVMGMVCIVYTVLGGIKGVIWTDVIQVFIFVIGAVATLFYIFAPGVDFWAAAQASHKFRTLDWRFDPTQVVTVWLVLQTLFETVRIYATQQEMTQRYLTAESTHKANVSVWMSILGYIPLGYLFYFIGVALFVYYQANPDPAVNMLKEAKRLDSLYAYFVVTRMPAGLAGLVIAAFFAAAMSTISSSMNSCSAVCLEDFYKRFWGQGKEDRHYLFVAKSLVLVWGVLAIVMAILFMQIALAQIVWAKVMAVSTCGILGLMALAFLPRKVNPWAGVLGVAASYACLGVLMLFLQVSPTVAFAYPIPKEAAGVNFLLWPVICNLVCFGVGFAVDFIWPRRGAAA
jgi:SSS family transporter